MSFERGRSDLASKGKIVTISTVHATFVLQLEVSKPRAMRILRGDTQGGESSGINWYDAPEADDCDDLLDPGRMSTGWCYDL